MNANFNGTLTGIYTKLINVAGICNVTNIIFTMTQEHTSLNTNFGVLTTLNLSTGRRYFLLTTNTRSKSKRGPGPITPNNLNRNLGLFYHYNAGLGATINQRHGRFNLENFLGNTVPRRNTTEKNRLRNTVTRHLEVINLFNNHTYKTGSTLRKDDNTKVNTTENLVPNNRATD